MKFTAYIVDDEQVNIKFISGLLKDYTPDIDIIGTSRNVNEAVKFINHNRPQILFLDIEIHSHTGFDLMKMIDTKDIQIVLITAFERYAIKAFKYEVNDYLLKPVSIDDMIDTVNNCKKRILEAQSHLKEKPVEQKHLGFLSVSHRGHIELIKWSDIVHLEARGGYTNIVTIDDKGYLSSKSLKENEAHLPSHLFIRVHHSFIVNVEHIKMFIRSKHGSLLMRNNKEIPISESRKKDVTDMLHL